MSDEKLDTASCDESSIAYECAWDEGFSAGAKFERERSKVLIEALEQIAQPHGYNEYYSKEEMIETMNDDIEIAQEALKQHVVADE
jgi:hypothetical protein